MHSSAGLRRRKHWQVFTKRLFRVSRAIGADSLSVAIDIALSAEATHRAIPSESANLAFTSERQRGGSNRNYNTYNRTNGNQPDSNYYQPRNQNNYYGNQGARGYQGRGNPPQRSTNNYNSQINKGQPKQNQHTNNGSQFNRAINVVDVQQTQNEEQLEFFRE